jgi:hypothetical protein
MFWYRVLVQDARGVMCNKEGDVNASNALAAMKAVEKINEHNWKGKLYQLALHVVDVESGEIDRDPLVLWNRVAGNVKGADAIPDSLELQQQGDAFDGWAPVQYEDNEVPRENTSQDVSFDPTEFGWPFTSSLTKPRQFTTIGFKENTT